MKYKKAGTLIMIVSLIVLIITAAVLLVSGGIPALMFSDSPSEISVTADGQIIAWGVGLNIWNGAVFDRLSTYEITLQETISAVDLSSEIVVDFGKNPPGSLTITEYQRNFEGEIIEATEITYRKEGAQVRFEPVLSDPMVYEVFFDMNANWGKNSCDYGFILRNEYSKTEKELLVSTFEIFGDYNEELYVDKNRIRLFDNAEVLSEFVSAYNIREDGAYSNNLLSRDIDFDNNIAICCFNFDSSTPTYYPPYVTAGQGLLTVIGSTNHPDIVTEDILMRGYMVILPRIDAQKYDIKDSSDIEYIIDASSASKGLPIKMISSEAFNAIIPSMTYKEVYALLGETYRQEFSGSIGYTAIYLVDEKYIFSLPVTGSSSSDPGSEKIGKTGKVIFNDLKLVQEAASAKTEDGLTVKTERHYAPFMSDITGVPIEVSCEGKYKIAATSGLVTCPNPQTSACELVSETYWESGRTFYWTPTVTDDLSDGNCHPTGTVVITADNGARIYVDMFTYKGSYSFGQIR